MSSDALKRRIAELADSNDWEELEILLLNTEDDWILKIVKDELVKGRCTLSSGILTCLKCKNRESSSIKTLVFENILKHLQKISVNHSREGSNFSSLLQENVENLPTPSLVNFIHFYLKHIEEKQSFEGRWVDVLPKLIVTICKRDDIILNTREYSGCDFKYYIITEIRRFKWTAVMTTNLLEVFKNINLTKEEMEEVVNKVEIEMKNLDVQSIPPLVYHLMVFCSDNLPSAALQVVIRYFNMHEKNLASTNNRNEDENSIISCDESVVSVASDVRESQGLVVLHLTHLAQFNPTIVKDYLKMLKLSTWLPHHNITPFNLAFSLSLASIYRYQNDVLDSLKSSLLKYYKLEEGSRQALWLNNTLGESCNMSSILVTTIKSYSSGVQVCQGFIDLSFNLLESGCSLRGETYPVRQVVHLAGVILPLVMQREQSLAAPILKQLTDLILTSSYPIQYIELFAKLCKQCTTYVWEHSSIVRELLEQLGYSTVTSAKSLFEALTPLLKLNMNLKDNLVIILRKLLSSREIEARKIALTGILQFLRQSRIIGNLPSTQCSMSFSSSLSQMSQRSVNIDVHGPRRSNSATNEALCLELLGMLRRCFTQQSEVRSFLYIGLNEVSEANKKLSTNIISTLYSHIQQFLDLRPVIFNPILSNKIILTKDTTVTLIEPIGDLLASMSRCTLILEKYHSEMEEENTEEYEEIVEELNRVRSMFDVLVDRLSKCDVDDLELQKDADFSLLTPIGQKNCLYLTELLNIYDVLIEYCFNYNVLTSDDQMNKLSSLFKIRKKLATLIKDMKSNKGAKKGDKIQNKTKLNPNQININLTSASSILFISLKSSAAKNDENLNQKLVQELQDIIDFQTYILSSIEFNLNNLKNCVSKDREKYASSLRCIAKLLLQECVEYFGQFDEDDEREVTRLRQCANLFLSILSYLLKHHSDKITSILREIAGKSANKSTESLFNIIIKQCQSMIINILSNEESSKDVIIPLQIISLLVDKIDVEPCGLKETQDWILQLCKDKEFDNCLSIYDTLYKLLFNLTYKTKAVSSILRTVSIEIHENLGDIEDKDAEDITLNFKSITKKSAPSIFTSVLNFLDDTLSYAESVLYRMKASLLCGVTFEEKKCEKNICTQFGMIMHSFNDLLMTSIPPGSKADALLVTVTKFYNILTLYIKYYFQLYKLKNNPQISESFQRFFGVFTQDFPEPVNKFLSYMGTFNQENMPTKKGVQTARVTKEMKIIPSLIFSMENFEKHIVILSKKSRCDLYEGKRLSIARDYKISLKKVENKIAQNDSDEDETQIDDLDTNMAGPSQGRNPTPALHSQNQSQSRKRSQSGDCSKLSRKKLKKS